ncbi:MAG: bifunctional folylpolyglutamate synthase/dihydrofolate synthase [Acidobacteriota bacterium]
MTRAADPLSWLFALERFGTKLGLEPMAALLEEMGQPAHSIPAALVAGTNGKGSTAATAAAVLSRAGARTLLYTSPHVASVCERIRINGRPIRQETLRRRLREVRDAVRRLRRTRALSHRPTFFEVLTAAALLHARAAGAAACVLEVGLGGRFDATNVVRARVSVITNIALEHAAFLGNTLGRIAWNKAGIIKAGGRVLTTETGESALRVIRREARARAAPLLQISHRLAHYRPDGLWDLELRPARNTSCGARLPARLLAARARLGGIYQGRNLLLGIAAAAALADHLHGVRLTASTLREGLAGVTLPGRFEVRRVSRGRLLILDAAHNPAAAECLAAAVRHLAGSRTTTLLMGLMADKDAGNISRILFPLARRRILCRPRHRRALPARRLGSVSRHLGPSTVIASPESAFRQALRQTPDGGILLVTGSFYLLGEIAPFARHFPAVQPV